MKKLLLLLLLSLPLVNYGQNIQFKLKMFNNSTGAVVDNLAENAIQESDTLRLEVHMAAVGTADYDSLVNHKYLFLDFQYTHNVLSPIANAYAFPGVDALVDAGPIKEKYDFPSTSFGALDSNLLNNYNNWQAGTTTYSPSNAKWSAVRIAFQLSDKSLQGLLDPTSYQTVTPIYDMLFVVKPGAAAETEKELRLNIATTEDIDGNQPTSIFSTNNPPQYQFQVNEAVTYNATLHFSLPAALVPTNFNVTVNTASGILGTFTLDSNADVILSDVTLGDVYTVNNLIPIDPSYIPNVHTVTDAYRAFKFLTDVGVNGDQTIYNNFGLFSADVNLNKAFNSQDVYGLLSYVLGLDVSGDFCLPTQDANGVWYHGCTATVLYENFTIEKLGAELDINNTGGENLYWNGNFTPTETNLEFQFAFWHHVDLDQSHSTSFPANITTSAITGKSFKDMTINFSSKPVGDTKLDMVSKIEGGLVKVELTHNGEDIVGLQARIKYDTSKLALKNIVFDTGNTVTNFSKKLQGELLFGGLSTDGNSNVKKGKAFVIEFTPIGTVNNTTGLFYFENTDAVKQNGDKLNLKIQ